MSQTIRKIDRKLKEKLKNQDRSRKELRLQKNWFFITSKEK